MPEQRFFFLISQKLSGAATAPEIAELDSLMEGNPEWQLIYKTLFARTRASGDLSATDIVGDGSGLRAAEEEAGLLAAQQAYAAHFVRMQLDGQFEGGKAREAGGKRRHYYLAAAGFILLVVIVAGLYGSRRGSSSKVPSSAPPKNEIATRKGSRSRILLPDGSLVWLNADSKIVYPDNFKGSAREVRLTGEAFFEVTRDMNRPFIIHAGTIDIQVLGTSFNVRSYPLEKRTEASLIKGSIEITVRGQHNKKVLLRPNEKLSVTDEDGRRDATTAASAAGPAPEPDASNSVRKGDASIQVSLDKVHFQPSDSSSIETLWVENKLAFESESLEVVAADIERWYNVEVTIQNEKLKSLRFTGIFNNKPLREVMEALQLTGRFHYSISGNDKVTIY